MQPIEEIRYLILAVQREGNCMFAESLRSLDLTPTQPEVLRILQDHQPLSLTAKGQEMATRVHHVEEAMYQFMAAALQGESLPQIQTLLWRFIEGRPLGEALARRKGKSP